MWKVVERLGDGTEEAESGLIDLDLLEELAKKATPGEWIGVTDNGRKDGLGIIGERYKRGTGQAIAVFAGTNGHRYADTQFVAAANPGAILQLISRLRMAEAGQ